MRNMFFDHVLNKFYISAFEIKQKSIAIIYIMPPAVIYTTAFIYGLYFEPLHEMYARASFFVLIAILILRLRQSVQPKVSRYFPLISVPFLMLTIWFVFVALFGEFNVNAIFYHLQFGVAGGGMRSDQRNFAIFLLLVALALLVLWTMVIRRFRVADRLDIWTFVPLIILSPMSWSIADGLGYSIHQSPQLIEQYYPVQTRQANEKRPNILHIYLESAERGFLESGYFVDANDPLFDMENRGFAATNIDQVTNTGWTIAGMVASQCGVPLIMPWLVTKNYWHEKGQFLPATNCLASLLKEAGYSTHYINGGDLLFAGKKAFFSEHGFDQRIGVRRLLPKYADQLSEWGVSDGGLLDEAEALYRSLFDQEEPFYQAVLTLGGHPPEGILAKPCQEGQVKLHAKLKIAQGVECTNKLVHAMLTRLENDGLLENTIVIIQSDHLSMGSDATPILSKRDRRNFFIAYGPGIEPMRTDRPASMLDVYPTILELIGLPSENGRAGLGVSLLSEKPNLMEAWGKDALSRAIKNDIELRSLLWGAPNIISGDLAFYAQ